jgi:hypothetical protein
VSITNLARSHQVLMPVGERIDAGQEATSEAVVDDGEVRGGRIGTALAAREKTVLWSHDGPAKGSVAFVIVNGDPWVLDEDAGSVPLVHDGAARSVLRVGKLFVDEGLEMSRSENGRRFAHSMAALGIQLPSVAL